MRRDMGMHHNRHVFSAVHLLDIQVKPLHVRLLPEIFTERLWKEPPVLTTHYNPLSHGVTLTDRDAPDFMDLERAPLWVKLLHCFSFTSPWCSRKIVLPIAQAPHRCAAA